MDLLCFLQWHLQSCNGSDVIRGIFDGSSDCSCRRLEAGICDGFGFFNDSCYGFMHDTEMVLAIAIAMVCETYRMGKSLWYLVVVFAMVPAMDQKEGFVTSLATPFGKVLAMGRILASMMVLAMAPRIDGICEFSCFGFQDSSYDGSEAEISLATAPATALQ